jgi:hypothetical protein
MSVMMILLRLFCVRVEPLQRADPQSRESYPLARNIMKMKNMAKTQQKDSRATNNKNKINNYKKIHFHP